jgi:hypothetical protein
LGAWCGMVQASLWESKRDRCCSRFSRTEITVWWQLL